MNRLLTATAAAALLTAASSFAFADTGISNGAQAPNQTPPASAVGTTNVPAQASTNPAANPVNGRGASTPAVASGETVQQSDVNAPRPTDSGKQAKEPKMTAADQAQPADNADSGGSAMAPKHHRHMHNAAMRQNSQEADMTKALNVLSANGYTNAQDLQATKGHKINAKASKDGQDVSVVVDPSAGTVGPQQNS